jgi:long-chain fatty acid transport protein
MKYLWALVLWGWWVPLKAGGLELNLYGQRNLAMGHTGTALAGDPSATFFNPGAMSWVEKSGLIFGSNAVFPLTSFLAKTPSVYQDSMERQVLTPVYVYALWQPGSKSRLARFTFGLSLNNPYVSGTKWPDDWKGKFISQEFTFNTFFLQPTASYQLSERWSVGLGLVYGFGDLYLRFAIPENGPNGTQASTQLSGRGYGLGINAGLYCQANERLALGLAYRSSLNMRFKRGEAQFNVPASLEEAYPSTAFTTRIPLPHMLTLGLTYQPEDRILLALDLDFDFWSGFDSLNFQLEQPLKVLENYPEARGYLNTFSLRLGAEFLANERLEIRGGLYYDASPVKDGFVSPELPDANYIGICTGLGINFSPRLSADLTHVYEFTGERTAILQTAAFGGTYLSNARIWGVGFNYTF